MKCGKGFVVTILWLMSSSAVASLLILAAENYDWRAAAMIFVACIFAVVMKTLYDNDWEEDDEAQD